MKFTGITRCENDLRMKAQNKYVAAAEAIYVE